MDQQREFEFEPKKRKVRKVLPMPIKHKMIAHVDENKEEIEEKQTSVSSLAKYLEHAFPGTYVPPSFARQIASTLGLNFKRKVEEETVKEDKIDTVIALLTEIRDSLQGRAY